jgi:hypothetical protein
VVSVLVEGGEHGAGASGPIVRDIVKAYYDKKAKKGQGQYTADYQQHKFGNGTPAEVAEDPQMVSKPDQSAAVLAADSPKKPHTN